MKRPWIVLTLSIFFLSMFVSCSSRKKHEGPVLLRFVSDQDLGLVAHPIDWMRPAEQDNPGVDCTLKLEIQGPPENVYSCTVKDAQNVFVVKVHEGYSDDPEDRRLVKVSVDSKWAVTRDFWIETLLNAGFEGASSNPKGSIGSKWTFLSPDEGTQARIFWNAKSQAVSVWIEASNRNQVPSNP